VGFLGGAFFLILAPTSSIAPIRDLAAEHRMYLPLAAVSVLATVGAYQAWRRFIGRRSDTSQPRKKLPIVIFAGGLAVAALAALAYRTIMRNQDYQSELAIWRDTAAKAPQNPRAHRNLAEELFKNGQPLLALEELNRAIEAKPDDAEAFNNRGIVRQNLGNLKLALADFSRAVDLGYGADAYFNRADLYLNRLQFDLAIADLSEAISLESKINTHSGSAARQKAAESYLRRGAAYRAISRLELALADFSQAIAIEPADADAYLGRGRVCQSLGKYHAARQDFDTALRLAPDHPLALNARAWLLATCPDARMRDGKQALADANRACRITHRDSAECLETLAAACAERDDFTSAVQWEAAALRLKKDDAVFAREAQRRLEMYRAGKPYRDPAAKQSPSASQSSE
jgi:tetratricopeptide (TPR) repeat protein